MTGVPWNIDFGLKMTGGSLKTYHVGALFGDWESMAEQGLKNLFENTQHFSKIMWFWFQIDRCPFKKVYYVNAPFPLGAGKAMAGEGP